LISLLCLGDVAKSFVFCDIDPVSLESISEANSSLNLSNTVELLQKDGMDSIWEKLHSMENVKDVFVFIDPYQIFAPSSVFKKDSVDVFIEAIKLGLFYI
jgi:16S rRNA G966 N2-methylase RsmD